MHYVQLRINCWTLVYILNYSWSNNHFGWTWHSVIGVLHGFDILWLKELSESFNSLLSSLVLIHWTTPKTKPQKYIGVHIEYPKTHQKLENNRGKKMPHLPSPWGLQSIKKTERKQQKDISQVKSQNKKRKVPGKDFNSQLIWAPIYIWIHVVK